MAYLDFKMPKNMTITGKSSVITHAFVSSILPVVEPTEEQVKEALTILGMLDKRQCSYCGEKASEWDHLRPLVVDQKPTGYISEIHNLVPACGKCNQSKGNKDWRKWMLSNAPLSPKTKGVKDIEDRMERLEKYEKWGESTQLNFEEIVRKEDWEQHRQNRHKIQEMMKESQRLAEQIKSQVANVYKKP